MFEMFIKVIITLILAFKSLFDLVVNTALKSDKVKSHVLQKAVNDGTSLEEASIMVAAVEVSVRNAWIWFITNAMIILYVWLV